MDVETLTRHAATHRWLPVAGEWAPLPLTLTYGQLAALTEADLTAEQWARVAAHGVFLVPDEIRAQMDWAATAAMAVLNGIPATLISDEGAGA